MSCSANPINVFFNFNAFEAFASPVTVIPFPVTLPPTLLDNLAIDLSSTSNGSTRVDVRVTGTFRNDFIFPNRCSCSKVPALLLEAGEEPLCIRTDPVLGVGLVLPQRPKPNFKILVVDDACNKRKVNICFKNTTSKQTECFPPNDTKFVGFTSKKGIIKIKIFDVASPGIALLFLVVGKDVGTCRCDREYF